ncbi:ATP-binding cassette domain-containing protein [Candidatus Bathyarchaeota archaeon]|nr:ATP-binding cassette domain-containing protein [Candidatus Bathyarchaeota archaeon]
MITLEKVSHEWSDFSLKNVSFNVSQGEYFVILGPTAAGKTLILETIAGFHIPRQGNILLNGKNVTHIPPEKRNIGFVYQDYSLFPHMSVEKNVAFGLKMRKVPKRDVETKVQSIMDSIDISHLKDRFPSTLSGGEQQRVALARALVIDPNILLLDEPLSALDPRTQESLREELKRIHKVRGATTIHITHNQDEALALADRIGVMMNGEVIQVDTPYKVFNEPASEEMAAFVGVENVVEGKVVSSEDGVALVEIGNYDIRALSSLTEGEVNVFIRPENVVLSKVKLESSARNSISGKITRITQFGATFRIYMDNSLSALVTKQAIEELGLNVGLKVYASFKATAVHVIKRCDEDYV